MTVKNPLTMLLHSISLDYFGVWEITISIRKTTYVYVLNSEFAVKQFENHYNKGHYGKALSVLNTFKIKPMREEENA